ncbi:MAG: hypothetical protein NZR01_09640, partial [Bryobacteraceae bacterium]|nr:hypothetical protein [Bryobacteraceae bacterium]
RRLADSSHVLALLQRYEAMFRRQYERALRLLWEHRDRQRRLNQPQPEEAARRRPSAPSPETRAALQALHVLLTAPTPGELENLQNEPETLLTPGTNCTSAPLPRELPRELPSAIRRRQAQRNGSAAC